MTEIVTIAGIEYENVETDEAVGDYVQRFWMYSIAHAHLVRSNADRREAMPGVHSYRYKIDRGRWRWELRIYQNRLRRSIVSATPTICPTDEAPPTNLDAIPTRSPSAAPQTTQEAS